MDGWIIILFLHRLSFLCGGFVLVGFAAVLSVPGVGQWKKRKLHYILTQKQISFKAITED